MKHILDFHHVSAMNRFVLLPLSRNYITEYYIMLFLLMVTMVTIFCCFCYKGVDFRSVYSEVDSKLVSTKIWDTAGQKRLVEWCFSACNGVGTFTPASCAVY